MSEDRELRTGELQPAPYNPRLISIEQMRLLEESMFVFGDLSPIVFNRRTGHVVGGHQRLKIIPDDADILRDIEHEEPLEDGTVATGRIVMADGPTFSYREVVWDEDKEMLANIAANQHGGRFDMPAVRDILSELDTGALELSLAGFTDAELAEIMVPEIPIDDDDGRERNPDGTFAKKGKITCPDCGREIEVGIAVEEGG